MEGIEKPNTAKSTRFAPGQRVKYVMNNRSFGAFMKSEQMRRVTVRVAMDIARSAQARTPSEKEGAREHTGLHQRVKEGFRVKREPSARFLKVGGNLRVKVEVVNVAAGSALVEFGARGVPRQRMLGSAGAQYGDMHSDQEI